MNSKLVIAILALVISGLIFAEMVRAEFTVDARSGLHFGVSAAIGATGSALVYRMQSEESRQGNQWWWRAAVFTACMVPGSYKEYKLDAHPDAGDNFFNAVGCGLGMVAGEAGAKAIITPYHDNRVSGVAVTMRY